MRILAIDTATMVTSVCLWEDHKIIGDYSVNQAKTHSESLMQMSEQLLKDLNLTYEDMDVFAVSKGPGSFTGLRIGITTAKTRAQVTGKPLVGISTLEALAYNVFRQTCPCGDGCERVGFMLGFIKRTADWFKTRPLPMLRSCSKT